MNPCEHCDNPDKANWQQRCLYKGSYPSRRAFVLSTFDAPCVMDSHDETLREIARRERYWTTIIFTSAIVSLGICLIWLSLK